MSSIDDNTTNEEENQPLDSEVDNDDNKNDDNNIDNENKDEVNDEKNDDDELFITIGDKEDISDKEDDYKEAPPWVKNLRKENREDKNENIELRKIFKEHEKWEV